MGKGITKIVEGRTILVMEERGAGIRDAAECVGPSHININ